MNQTAVDAAHRRAAFAGRRRGYVRAARKRSALPMTDTELSAIAALAMMGLSRMPSQGYSTPAATGMPMTL